MGLDLTKNFPGIPAIEFLESRILNNSYRGKHLSQHNRYNLKDVEIIIETLQKYTVNGPLTIRTTDLKKRPFNTPEESNYATYVNEISSKLSRSTQDSVRKNLFVEFSRMGFLNRYDKDMKLLNPFVRGRTKFVSISNLGSVFVNQKNIINQSMIFARGVDNVMLGMASEIFQAMIQLEFLTLNEYTFFMSFVGCSIGSKTYFLNEIIEYIIQFRRLSTYQKQGVEQLVKTYCIPNNFNGNKTIKKDFHNWINEAQQIFTILGDTAYYEYDKKVDPARLIFKVNRTLLNNQTPVINLKRSLLQKTNYFSNHKVSKKPGFELHHIVPLFWATNPVEFSILDDWKNMIYIDAKSHSIISVYRPKNVELEFDKGNIKLIDQLNNYFELIRDYNVIYNDINKQIMINTNKQILSSF